MELSIHPSAKAIFSTKMRNDMKIIFMGTPDFSAVVLEKLNSLYPVSCVVTGLDKEVGRGHQIKFSPCKEKAIELGIPVYQFGKVSREGIDAIKALCPDIIVTAAFGQILSDEFLSIPRIGVLNVHASLLPKYRGSSPIQWSIINGDDTTGITIMRTVKEVDAGDILLTKVTHIGKKENAGELFDRLAILGGEAICEAIGLIESGNYTFTPQDSALATHCSMISKEDGIIDFSLSAEAIDCFVRGMTPWPSAYIIYNDKIIKIFDVEKYDYEGKEDLGTILFADTKHGIVVKCSDGAVRLKQIQLQGSKRMDDVSFLLGRKLDVGYKFAQK